MFEAFGKPVARAVVHRIDLIDPLSPAPYLHLYRILEDELTAVKYTISDYIGKGLIRTNSSLYGAPVLLIHKNG